MTDNMLEKIWLGRYCPSCDAYTVTGHNGAKYRRADIDIAWLEQQRKEPPPVPRDNRSNAAIEAHNTAINEMIERLRK